MLDILLGGLISTPLNKYLHEIQRKRWKTTTLPSTKHFKSEQCLFTGCSATKLVPYFQKKEKRSGEHLHVCLTHDHLPWGIGNRPERMDLKCTEIKHDLLLFVVRLLFTPKIEITELIVHADWRHLDDKGIGNFASRFDESWCAFSLRIVCCWDDAKLISIFSRNMGRQLAKPNISMRQHSWFNCLSPLPSKSMKTPQTDSFFLFFYCNRKHWALSVHREQKIFCCSFAR